MPEEASAAAPGKLFIAGEYAVVDPGQPAILVAVDRYLTADVQPVSAGSSGGKVTSEAYARPRRWIRSEGKTVTFDTGEVDYLTAAIGTVENYRESAGVSPASYDLHITSYLTDGSRKLGLGSSAAVVTAVIAAAGRMYDLDLTLQQRFRLGVCALIHISPRASCGDLAASTYGGWIHYTSPDRQRVAESLTRVGVAETIADSEVWRGCGIRWIDAPALPLLVGWTGAPARTDALVAAARADDSGEGGYPEFHTDSAGVVDDILASTRAGDRAGLLAAVRRGRVVLNRFAKARGVVVETSALTALCEAAERHGGAGKTSGAGGGDCGIAFAPQGARTEILREWGIRGITALDLAPHPREGETP